MAIVMPSTGEGPGTHLLIVGAAGAAPEKKRPVLDSAPRSAAALLDWFAKHYRNPQAPVASLDLLLSLPSDEGRTLSFDDQTFEVGTPDFSTLHDAASSWMERAGSHPDNIAVFYFAGYGHGQGRESALVLDGGGARRSPSRILPAR